MRAVLGRILLGIIGATMERQKGRSNVVTSDTSKASMVRLHMPEAVQAFSHYNKLQLNHVHFQEGRLHLQYTNNCITCSKRKYKM